MSDDQKKPFNDPEHPSWSTGPGRAGGGDVPPAPPGPPSSAPSGQDPYAAQPQNPYAQGPYVQAPQGQDAQPGYAQPGYGQPGYQQPGYGQAPYGQPYGYAQTGYAAPVKTLSLISMVLGIVSIATLGTTVVTQIAAVVLGHIALKREPAGRGMAIAGLVMGYLVIALGLLALLAFILFAATVGPMQMEDFGGLES